VSITLEQRLYSSMTRVPHVWTAHVQHTSSLPSGPPSAYPPLLVAKIFDPTFVDSEISDCTDPLALRDKSVLCEVEAYRIIEPLQGTVVPRFYGHFIAPLPSQQNRTVNVILMEYVQGTDLRILVPHEIAQTVCSVHKEAIIVRALTVFFDVYALGVVQRDMQPRNIILRPHQQREPGTKYCNTSNCPLHLEVDCMDLRMVMVDFEVVEFKEPDSSFSERSKQIDYINRNLKETYVSRWLESAMI
jgi:serine/threonine protein kinase